MRPQIFICFKSSAKILIEYIHVHTHTYTHLCVSACGFSRKPPTTPRWRPSNTIKTIIPITDGGEELKPWHLLQILQIKVSEPGRCWLKLRFCSPLSKRPPVGSVPVEQTEQDQSPVGRRWALAAENGQKLSGPSQAPGFYGGVSEDDSDSGAWRSDLRSPEGLRGWVLLDLFHSLADWQQTCTMTKIQQQIGSH